MTKLLNCFLKRKKFKYNTRGKLRKDEIVELRRTHKKNILSWVKEEKRKVMEMDKFEELTSNMDSEVQMKVTEADLDKEDRLNRVRSRQKEFWTGRMVKDVMEMVLKDVVKFRMV